MKYKFTLPEFPDSDLELETSFFTGRSKLIKDGVSIEQSKERRKPFLIPDDSGQIIKAFVRQTFPDFGLVIEINGVTQPITEKLKWYQYILGALPIALMFFGGAIGGAIGGVAMASNFNMFRQEGSETSKYLKVVGITVLSFVVYIAISFVFLNAVKR